MADFKFTSSFPEVSFLGLDHKILGTGDSQSFLLFYIQKLWDSKFYIMREQREGVWGQVESFLPVQSMPLQITKTFAPRSNICIHRASVTSICFPWVHISYCFNLCSQYLPRRRKQNREKQFYNLLLSLLSEFSDKYFVLRKSGSEKYFLCVCA